MAFTWVEYDSCSTDFVTDEERCRTAGSGPLRPRSRGPTLRRSIPIRVPLRNAATQLNYLGLPCFKFLILPSLDLRANLETDAFLFSANSTYKTQMRSYIPCQRGSALLSATDRATLLGTVGFISVKIKTEN